MGSTLDVVEIPDNLEGRGKKRGGLLIEEVVLQDIFRQSTSKNTWKMWKIHRIEEVPVHIALRAAVMDMAIIPMICRFTSQKQAFNFCYAVLF